MFAELNEKTIKGVGHIKPDAEMGRGVRRSMHHQTTPTYLENDMFLTFGRMNSDTSDIRAV